jgi:hypothetical protein
MVEIYDEMILSRINIINFYILSTECIYDFQYKQSAFS